MPLNETKLLMAQNVILENEFDPSKLFRPQTSHVEYATSLMIQLRIPIYHETQWYTEQ